MCSVPRPRAYTPSPRLDAHCIDSPPHKHLSPQALVLTTCTGVSGHRNVIMQPSAAVALRLIMDSKQCLDTIISFLSSESCSMRVPAALRTQFVGRDLLSVQLPIVGGSPEY